MDYLSELKKTQPPMEGYRHNRHNPEQDSEKKLRHPGEGTAKTAITTAEEGFGCSVSTSPLVPEIFFPATLHHPPTTPPIGASPMMPPWPK